MRLSDVCQVDRRALASRAGRAQFPSPRMLDTLRAAQRSDCSLTAPIIYLVDDDLPVRDALESMIRSSGWQACVCASAEEFLSRPRVLGPSCLVLDVTLPGLSGLDLQRRVAERSEMPVIFMASHGDTPTVVCAMKAGAIDFLVKPIDAAALVGAIERALVHSQQALRQEAEQQLLLDRFVCLTYRERQVMTLVIAGRLNKLVGAELGITEATVKAHRGNLMRKMKARSLADLMKFGAKLGLSGMPIA
jgi:FixJ family two-component response regulator